MRAPPHLCLLVIGCHAPIPQRIIEPPCDCPPGLVCGPASMACGSAPNSSACHFPKEPPSSNSLTRIFGVAEMQFDLSEDEHDITIQWIPPDGTRFVACGIFLREPRLLQHGNDNWGPIQTEDDVAIDPSTMIRYAIFPKET